MGHAVHYRNAAGESRLEDVSSLSAAVELVERLRNQDGAQDVRVFREVPLEVKTYYKVVVAEEDADTPPAPSTPPAPARDAADEPPPGAMNISPPPANATAAHAVAGGAEDDGDQPRRSSLFNRG